jgi:hypothetical protein
MQRVATTGYCGRESSQTLRRYIYQILKSLIPPEYNWQSVPSISGKNGILTLSTLNDVNDGDPITTSDTSKIIIVPQSNVKQLVLNRIQQN